MEAIYMRFAPHKLGKVGGLLVRYAGDEERLLRIVRRKYVDTGNNRAALVAVAAAAAAVRSLAFSLGGRLPQMYRPLTSKTRDWQRMLAADLVQKEPASR